MSTSTRSTSSSRAAIMSSSLAAWGGVGAQGSLPIGWEATPCVADWRTPTMGVMTVAAPSTGLTFGSTIERVRAGVSCPRCRATSDPGEPFCAHCGERVVVVREGRPPADVAATRSLQLAGVLVLANAIIGSLTFGVVFVVSDAARVVEAALFLEGIKLLVVGSLAGLSIRMGVRGIRDTAAGGLRGRGRAIAGIVISSIFALLVLVSSAAVAVLFLL